MAPSKFSITNDSITDAAGRTLYRIKALKDIENDYSPVKAGDLGGYVQSRENLSPFGKSWVHDNACVVENAVVAENAQICDEAFVGGRAVVGGNAQVGENAYVAGNALVLGNAKVQGKAVVVGSDMISGNSIVGVNLNDKEREIGGVTRLLWNESRRGLTQR